MVKKKGKRIKSNKSKTVKLSVTDDEIPDYQNANKPINVVISSANGPVIECDAPDIMLSSTSQIEKEEPPSISPCCISPVPSEESTEMSYLMQVCDSRKAEYPVRMDLFKGHEHLNDVSDCRSVMNQTCQPSDSDPLKDASQHSFVSCESDSTVCSDENQNDIFVMDNDGGCDDAFVSTKGNITDTLTTVANRPVSYDAPMEEVGHFSMLTQTRKSDIEGSLLDEGGHSDEIFADTGKSMDNAGCLVPSSPTIIPVNPSVAAIDFDHCDLATGKDDMKPQSNHQSTYSSVVSSNCPLVSQENESSVSVMNQASEDDYCMKLQNSEEVGSRDAVCTVDTASGTVVASYRKRDMFRINEVRNTVSANDDSTLLKNTSCVESDSQHVSDEAASTRPTSVGCLSDTATSSISTNSLSPENKNGLSLFLLPIAPSNQHVGVGDPVQINRPVLLFTSSGLLVQAPSETADRSTHLGRKLPSGTLRYPHACDVEGCDKVFSTLAHLKLHQATHGQKELLCPFDGCARKFVWPANLKYHQLTHTGERLYKCYVPGCEKSFYTSQRLMVHMRTHTGERPFTCREDGCRKSFLTAGNLQNHMRTHTGERPYVCEFDGCEWKFAEYSSLKKHMLVHSGEKPHTCEVCGRGFTQRGSRNVHMRRQHPEAAALLANNALEKVRVSSCTQQSPLDIKQTGITAQDDLTCDEVISSDAASLSAENSGANVVVLSQPQEIISMTAGYHDRVAQQEARPDIVYGNELLHSHLDH